MIADILKEKTPETKPRFFLHDEMKAWLADNLKLNMRIGHHFSTNYAVINKLQNLGFYNLLPVGLAIETSISIGDEYISTAGTSISMIETEKLTEHFLTVNEKVKVRLDYLEAICADLQATNQELRKRLDLIENPLPV